MISDDQIVEVRQWLVLLSEAETRKLVAKFQKRQTPLLVYTAAVSERENLNDDEQDVLITLTLLVWLAVEKEYGRLKKVSIKDLESSDELLYSDPTNFEPKSLSLQPLLSAHLIDSLRNAKEIQPENKETIQATLRLILDLLIRTANT
jgi:hypothetical protein